MMHPDTQLGFVSDQVGLGVFASRRIPAGTVVYVADKLDIYLLPDDPLIQSNEYRDHIEKYSYMDETGTRIICWDHGKYVNHCCNANTMSTGYGFEVAIRDIQPGEQVTDEYGMFNLDQPMDLQCQNGPCRGKVCAGDLDRHFREWDKKVVKALANVMNVEQPLYDLRLPCRQRVELLYVGYQV